MKFVTTLLLYAGYTLIYGAVANHGQFAWKPWMGLFADAYTGDSSGGGNGNSGTGNGGGGNSGGGSGGGFSLPNPLDILPGPFGPLSKLLGQLGISQTAAPTVEPV